MVSSGYGSTSLTVTLGNGAGVVTAAVRGFPCVISDIGKLGGGHFTIVVSRTRSSATNGSVTTIAVSLNSNRRIRTSIRSVVSSRVGHGNGRTGISVFTFATAPGPAAVRLFNHLGAENRHRTFRICSVGRTVRRNFVLSILRGCARCSAFCRVGGRVRSSPQYGAGTTGHRVTQFMRLRRAGVTRHIRIVIRRFHAAIVRRLNKRTGTVIVATSHRNTIGCHRTFRRCVAGGNCRNVRTLMTFSNGIGLPSSRIRCARTSLGNFPRSHLAGRFSASTCRMLLITGGCRANFSRPGLYTVCMLGGLGKIGTIRALSHLGHVYTPCSGGAFILSFIGDCRSVGTTFTPCCAAALLSGSMAPDTVCSLRTGVSTCTLFSPTSVSDTGRVLCTRGMANGRGRHLAFFLRGDGGLLRRCRCRRRHRTITAVHGFIHCCRFLLRISYFRSRSLRGGCGFVTCLLTCVGVGRPNNNFGLSNGVGTSGFIRGGNRRRISPGLITGPMVGLPATRRFKLARSGRRHLSRVVSRVGDHANGSCSGSIIIGTVLRVHSVLVGSSGLEADTGGGARGSFRFSCFSSVSSTLVRNLSRGRSFFSLLLSGSRVGHRILNVFTSRVCGDLHGTWRKIAMYLACFS